MDRVNDILSNNGGFDDFRNRRNDPMRTKSTGLP